MRWMLTGVSSATRVSHQRAISSAWRLVSEAANLQPVLPVQATRPARMALASMARPSASILLLRGLELVGRDARDQQVLPDREPDIAVAQVARDGRQVRASARPSCGRPAPRRRSNCSPSCFCAWMPIWAVRSKAGRGANAPRHGAVELAAELLLHQREEFLDAQRVEHVFQPRLGAVGAVAVFDEHAHHRVRHLQASAGRTSTPVSRGEIVMAGDAAEAEPEPDAGRKAEAVFHLDGLEADVVGVFQHRHRCRRRRRRR